MPDLVHCRDCRHWDRSPGGVLGADPGIKSVHRRCARVIHINEHPEAPSDLTGACVTDSDDYLAILWTGPDFGCTLGERKESDNG